LQRSGQHKKHEKAVAGLFFDFHGLAVNTIWTDPAIYPTAIVTNLETLAVDGFDEVKVVAAFDFHQDDVIDCERERIAGFEGDEVAVIHFVAHGVATRTDLDGFISTECFDGEFGPTHEDFYLWKYFSPSTLGMMDGKWGFEQEITEGTEEFFYIRARRDAKGKVIRDFHLNRGTIR